jgi:hypothetical protein
MENVGICTYFMFIWNILRPFGIFYGNVCNVVIIWYIFHHFAVLCQEKSGNPDFTEKVVFSRLKKWPPRFFWMEECIKNRVCMEILSLNKNLFQGQLGTVITSTYRVLFLPLGYSEMMVSGGLFPS